MPQFEKNQSGQSLWAMYSGLHVKAVTQPQLPDLVVWPETCMPIDWAEPGPGVPADQLPAWFRKEVDTAGHYFGPTDLRATDPKYTNPKPDWKAATLFGLSGYEWVDGQAWRYNSALLVAPRGGKLGRYDKMHLVPFGEYVPLREVFPWMQTFTPYTDDYSCRPGEHWTRFPLATPDGRTFTFGCLICYEDSDPYLARQYVGGGQPVDFLVNISNDGWFDGTEEHEQHLAICRFRAVETRRSVVRAVNMGVSGVIDPDGRVVALPGETWRASKKVEAVVTAVVPLDTRGSWYARLGDWLPVGCGVLLVVGLVAPRVFPRRAA
jgi:apolipoprotein N-acyltransferase